MRRGGSTVIRALVIRGPSGVGKTAVGHAVSALLREQSIGHALVDTDELVRILPPPRSGPRLTRLAALNLSAVWANYRAAGARRLILVGVIESLDVGLAWIRESVPGAHFSVVRLRATGDALQERLCQRQATAGLTRHLRESIAVATRMDREAGGACIVIDTTGRAIGDIANDIVEQSGWA